MAQKSLTNWEYDAEYIQACNCDWGCPCNVGAKPTYGFCEGGAGMAITKGHYDGTSLDGVRFAWFAKWPGQIHEGGGTCGIYVDEKANAQQRQAIENMITGKATGLPWTVLSATMDHWLPTKAVPFEWSFKGAHSNFKAGSILHVDAEPIRNPVSGAESTATIIVPDGFIFQEALIASTRSFSVFDTGLKYAHQGTNVHTAKVHHKSG
jgi:hypothetical protein